MSVKDIIKLACVFLNKQELIETNVFDETLRKPTEEEQKEVEMLLRCLNLIVGEISCDYLPLINQENVTVSNKTIEFPPQKSIDLYVIKYIIYKKKDLSIYLCDKF